MLLGLNSVKNIAIAASLDKLFRGGRIVPEFNACELWMHSIAVATGARLLAERSGMVLPDEAFLAGMIHDLGIMVELQARRSLFIQLVEELGANPSLTFREAEAQSLGATHEEFGAALCRKWKFPASFEEVTGYHHHPLDLLGDARLLPAMVHVADILAARIGVGYIRTVETDTIDPQLLEMLTLTADDVAVVGEALPEATCEAQLLLSE